MYILFDMDIKTLVSGRSRVTKLCKYVMEYFAAL